MPVNHITEQNVDFLLFSFNWPHMIHETHDAVRDKLDGKRWRRLSITAWSWFNHFFWFCLLLVLAASVPMPSYPSSGSGSSSSSSSTSHLTSPPVSTAQGMHCLCWWSPCLCVWNEISAFTLSWWKSLNTHFGWAWCSVLSSLEFGSWRLAYSPQDIFISVCHCLLDEKPLWKKLYEWH